MDSPTDLDSPIPLRLRVSIAVVCFVALLSLCTYRVLSRPGVDWSDEMADTNPHPVNLAGPVIRVEDDKIHVRVPTTTVDVPVVNAVNQFGNPVTTGDIGTRVTVRGTLDDGVLYAEALYLARGRDHKIWTSAVAAVWVAIFVGLSVRYDRRPHGLVLRQRTAEHDA